MIKSSLSLVLCLGVATAALAHSGVENPAVMARMDAMSRIGAEVTVIGLMARGETLFDAEEARAAAAAIAEQAALVPELFATPEDDPKSEARKAIWEDYDRFIEMNGAMETVAIALSESITTQEDAMMALRTLGQTCRTCHEAFRE